ncbi:MAG: hypothetical protein JNL32_00985 [Candidatus Kapabacteria bacterium]|nr:hypothetical protein [Candidatus Kapabacteria bacterium]
MRSWFHDAARHSMDMFHPAAHSFLDISAEYSESLSEKIRQAGRGITPTVPKPLFTLGRECLFPIFAIRIVAAGSVPMFPMVFTIPRCIDANSLVFTRIS